MRIGFILFFMFFPLCMASAQSDLMRGVEKFEAGEIDSAIVYLRRSLDEQETKPAYILLTHAHKALGQHDSAILYGKRLIELAMAERDSSTVANYHYTVGTVYADMGRNDDAAASFNRGAAVAQSIGDYPLAVLNLDREAGIYRLKGDHETALDLLDKASVLARASGDHQAMGSVRVSQAGIYDHFGRHDDAIAALDQAVEYFEQSGDTQLRDAAKGYLAQLEAQSGRTDIKTMTSEQATQNLDFSGDSLAIPNSWQDMKLQVLTANANAEDKTAKFDLLRRDYLEKQIRNLRLRIWLIAALVVMAIIVAGLLYRRKMRLVRRYIDGLESERARISKELHDGICNDLLAVEMQMGGNGALQQARENIRCLSHELMPPAFQYATLDEILSDYLGRQGVGYSSTGMTDVPQKIAFEIYRIVQEAVGNALKHAHANTIEVALELDARQLKLTIKDDGRGGAEPRLVRERVESIGGSLTVDSGEKGTTLIITTKI